MTISAATTQVLNSANSMDNLLKSTQATLQNELVNLSTANAPNYKADLQAIIDSLSAGIAKLDQVQADYADVTRMNP